MPTEQIENLERTVYEGLLGPSQSLVLGCLVALLVAWLLWRERRALGAWAIWFWALRIGAIGLALWMLAGPTHLAIQRITSPQSIAVLVDDTGSMTVTDPPAPTEDLRWRLAAEAENLNRVEAVVVLCDRAGVQLAEAVTAGVALGDAIAEHLPPRDLRPIADRARRATTAARRLFDAATSAAGDGNELFAERIDRVIELLDDSAIAQLEQIEEEIDTGDASSPESIDSATEALNESLASAQRRGLSLARDAAQDAVDKGATVSGVAPPRRDRVNAVLAGLEERVLSRLEAKCIVHRLRFSQTAPQRDSLPTIGKTGDRPPTRLVSTDAAPLPYEENQTNADDSDTGPPPVTDLAAALRQIEQLRASGPLRMALLLTDGRHNAPSDNTPQDVAARIASTPVHVTPVGASVPVRDILIHRVEAPARVARNDTATIEVMLTALDCAGEEVEVTLTRDGEELERKPFSIGGDWQDGRVTFRIDTSRPGSDELGPREYEVEVDAVDDEASLTNNLGAVSIEVVRNKLRVLLADRGPRWEYRYLQQLFRRDKHVDFDELLILPELRTTGSREATGRLPRDVEAWAEYDVVILGDLGPETLGQAEQQSLAEYVQQRGGSVIVIAGREHMPHSHLGAPMIDLLPVRTAPGITPADGFGVALTDDARLASCVALRESFRDSQATWQRAFSRLPIYGLSTYCRPKPNARVLVEATPVGGSLGIGLEEGDNPLAFFSWHPIGSGKVAYLAAPQSYLLRFRRGDRDHHAFWGQTLRWITAEQGAGRQPVRIDTDRTQYVAGQEVEVTVWLRDPQGRPVTDAEVVAEARSLDEVAARVPLQAEGEAPGRYVGSFDHLPMGAFEITPVGEMLDALLADAKSDEPRKLISVESSGDIEMINTQCDRPLLQQIAELTGGHITPPTALAELLEVASLDPEVTESPPRRTPLWNRWSYLMIIAGCLMTEWVVRKAKGLT